MSSPIAAALGWHGRYRWRSTSVPPRSACETGVTVLVPTWNGAAILPSCLEAIQAQELPPSRVLVVDNASTDSTPHLLSRYPGIEVMRLERNLGYSGALSHALTLVATEYVAVLNNDARPGPSWLRVSVECLNGAQGAGGVYPLAVHPDGLIDTAGDVITVAGFAYKRGYHRRPPVPAARKGVFVSAPGVASVYRLRALLEVGGWDAGLHSQWDDIDLGLRLWLAGWDLVALPTVGVLHLQGASAARDRWRREFLAARNETVVLLKTFSVRVLLGMLPHRAAYGILAVASHLVRGTLVPHLAGRVAAGASTHSILSARRERPRRRHLGQGALERRWVPIWWGLSRCGGHRVPLSS